MLLQVLAVCLISQTLATSIPNIPAEMTARGIQVPLEESEMTAREIQVPVGESEMTAREIQAPLEESEMTAREIQVPMGESEMTAREIQVPLEESEMTAREIQVPVGESEMTAREIQVPLAESEMTAREIQVPLAESEMTAREIQVPQKEKVADMPEERQGINLWAELGLDFSDYDVDNPEGKITSKSEVAQCLLDQHNYYRESVGLQKVKWSGRLANLALNTSMTFREDGCRDYHRTEFNSENWVGENLFSIKAMPYFFGEGRDMCENAKMAVDRWYQEIQYYTYPLGNKPFGSCDDLADFSSYGHFIQVMWQKVRKIGCSYAYCYNYDDIYMMPKIIVNCYYDQPILKGARAFGGGIATALNEWSENDQYGGLKTCTVD